MKRLLYVVFLIMALALTAHGQYTPSREKYQLVTNIVSQCKHPLKEWSDGKVNSLSSILYIKMGVVPKSSDGSSVVVLDSYKVMDVTAGGLRVSPIYITFVEGGFLGGATIRAGGIEGKDIFIEGVKGLSDRTYSVCLIKRIGDYTYTTVMGGSRTIPRYEYGTPITMEEFVEKFKKQK